MYLLFTIISPIIGKLTNIDLSEIDYEKYFEETETYQTMSEILSTTNNKSVEEIYITNLEQDMKNKLIEKGYVVQKIELEIEKDNEENYGTIKKIKLVISKNKEEGNTINSENIISVNKIEEVEIGNTIKSEMNKKDDIKSNEKSEIKEYLASVYEVNKKNIKINE